MPKKAAKKKAVKTNASNKRRPKTGARGAAHPSSRAGGRRWGLTLLMFGLGLALGLIGPWAWWLDREASMRFAERQWTQAGRVYARALELYEGRALAHADLKLELNAAGLTETLPLLPGRYQRLGERYTLALPEARFSDGTQPAMRVDLTLSNGRIVSINSSNDQFDALLRLPPAELGNLLPLDKRDRTLVPIAEFPTLLVAGIQAVEDRQFRYHHGIDPRAILRAALRNLRSGGLIQGGSTITQQLVKNIFLTADRTWLRKFNESLMAVSLEARFSKAEILEAYLNEVFLGQSGNQAIHGFGRAAEYYFGLPVQSLSTDQIALLIGMVRGASWYHPVRNPERAMTRRNLVLQIFADTGLIDQDELDRARQRPLGADPRRLRANRMPPAFIDLVRRQLRADYRESDLREKGLKIFTTLSPSGQHHAEQALFDGLAEQDDGSRQLQGAIVLTEPDTGEIRALVGDRQFRRPGFNRALDARRQIGSVVKPFVYLLALADSRQFNLVTPVLDAPLSLPQDGDRPEWQPQNYDGESHGLVPLMTALAMSYNQASVRVGLDVGVGSLFRLLEQLGVAPGSQRHPAALLGAIDLTPLQVAQLYQPLAAGGYSTPLRAITDVIDQQGQTIGRYPIRLRPIRERDALALLDFALTESIQRGTGRGLAARLTQPDARRANIRGKTGTTNDRRDAWFAGFTEQWLAVVWIGRDDAQPAGVTGATTALPIWARLFDALPQHHSGRNWPPSLNWFWVDWPNPELAEEACPGARAIPFAEHSELTEYSRCMR
ncbi:MAG: penicillin-binding protein 1B [Pseudomonadota bacterium]